MTNKPITSTWLELTHCDELTDTSLSDALGMLFDSAISTLGTTALYLHQNKRSLSIDNPAASLRMLERQMMDGKTLVDHWWETVARHRNDDKPAWMNFPVEEIEKLDQESVDFAMQVQNLNEDERVFLRTSIEAAKRRRGMIPNFKPDDYINLYQEREGLITSCYQTLEQLKALGDLLIMSTEHNDTPPFFDGTLENIGQLIVNRTKSTLAEIHPETDSEGEVTS